MEEADGGLQQIILGDLVRGPHLGDRFKSVGLSGVYGAKRMIKNKAKDMGKSGVRLARHALTGGLTGGTAALLALGAGASMDPGKAAALVASAATAGYSFGNYYGDKFAKGTVGAANSARAAFWGEDMKKIDQAKFDKEFMQSGETMTNLTKALGSTSAAQKAIKDGSVQALLNNNVTDPGKVAKALALKKKYMASGLSDDQALVKAVAMAKWNRDVNPGIFNPNSREETVFKNNLFKQLTASGMGNDEAKSRIDEILKDLEYFET